MDDTQLNENLNQKTIDISPLSKWRRILLYFCDLIICFFGAWVLMNVAALPIGKAASGYDEHIATAETAAVTRNSILYGNELLFYSSDVGPNNFDKAFEYTSIAYVKHFVYDEDPSFDKYDVIATYFIGIKNDKDTYTNLLKERDAQYGFFTFVDGMPVLKDSYKEQFKPSLPNEKEPDKNNEEGERNFKIFQDQIFASSYSVVTKDILENDLTYEGHSFVNAQNVLNDQTKYMDILVVSTTYISMIIAGIIFFLVVPLCNQNGKSISMLMMRVERVSVHNIYLLKKSEVALISVYQIVACLGALLFIPMPNVTIDYVFRLSSLFFMAILAMIIVLGSFVFLMFNKYNRTLFDYLSRSVMISSDSLDEIYRSKGYKV